MHANAVESTQQASCRMNAASVMQNAHSYACSNAQGNARSNSSNNARSIACSNAQSNARNNAALMIHSRLHVHHGILQRCLGRH
eukprot:457521-Pelagomonas_calceolata.AAC.1